MSFTSATGKSALPPLRPLPATKASPKIQGIYPSEQNYIQRLPDIATGPISVPQRALCCISRRIVRLPKPLQASLREPAEPAISQHRTHAKDQDAARRQPGLV